MVIVSNLLNRIKVTILTLKVPETKIAEFANSVDSDEAAHDELPHPDLHCLPSGLCIFSVKYL